MNAATRADLDATPVPVENGYRVSAMAILREGQWRTAWGMDGGRRPEPFGEAHASAKEAARAARHINERGGA